VPCAIIPGKVASEAGKLAPVAKVNELIEEAAKLDRTNPPSGKMVGIDQRRKSQI